MDSLQELQSLGITLPTPAYLFGAIVFGIVGMVAYWYGRKSKRQTTKWLGIVLMLYPYVIPTTWLLYVVGAGLCAGIFFDRGRSRG